MLRDDWSAEFRRGGSQRIAESLLDCQEKARFFGPCRGFLGVLRGRTRTGWIRCVQSAERTRRGVGS